MTTYASNQHCVEKLIVLSETHAVVATEDIYDEHGIKLLAKGANISRDLQERLLLRKLRAPLESSLSVRDGVTVGEMLQGALELIEQNPALEAIAGTRSARELMREARRLHIPPPLTLLISCARDTDPDHYKHTQVTAAICAGIAAQLDANLADAQILLMSALLHDLGEIYVNPDYLHSTRRLSPQEWKHVATHPHVGQLLIQSLTSLPASVAACVGQHHERSDGSGYPAQLPRGEQHMLASWLAAADAAAALVHRGETSGERISLALRIVPGEFDRPPADVLIRAMYTLYKDAQGELPASSIEQAQALLQQIHAASDELQRVAEATRNEALKVLCDKELSLLGSFIKAMRATGILDAGRLPREDINDHKLLAEMQQIVREVSWRLRNLARNIYVRVDAWKDPESLALVQQAIELLDASLPSQAA